MSDFAIFNTIKEDMEESADIIKTCVIQTLIDENKLTQEEGDNWCKNHTIIMKRKSIFRTLSEKWKNSKELTGSYYYIVVKLCKGE